MDLTEDSFRALAASSPWRWRTLHFVRRSAGERGPGTEAWLVRPGRLRVRSGGGRIEMVNDVPDRSGTTVVAFAVEDDEAPPVLPEFTSVPASEVTPTYRPDGLVAARPDLIGETTLVAYDDPMPGDGGYDWVAMLDPVELSHDVRVSELRQDTLHDRPVWRAFVRAEAGYDPRCGCCPLMFAEAALVEECGPDWRRVVYFDVAPEGYEIALDVGTGVVVDLAPVGGDTHDGFSVQIHSVDTERRPF